MKLVRRSFNEIHPDLRSIHQSNTIHKEKSDSQVVVAIALVENFPDMLILFSRLDIFLFWQHFSKSLLVDLIMTK